MRRSLYLASSLLAAIAGIASFALPGCGDDPPGTVVPTDAGADAPDAGEAFGPIGDRQDLPVDDRVSIENLSAPVDVVRDKDGRPHIYASKLLDAMRAEGYVVALDRAIQLEIMRRLAEGRLAQIFGSAAPSLIDQDIVIRHIGLGRVAKAQYDALPDGETRQILDAYADGVSQVFRKLRSGEIPLPASAKGYPLDAFTDWSGADSLAIGRFQTYLLAYDVDLDLYIQSFFDSARTTFTPTDPDPLIQKRAGLERDFWRFAPAELASTMNGYPMPNASPKKIVEPRRSKAQRRARGSAARAANHKSLEGYLNALGKIRERLAPEGFGSNNWAVDAAHSATGHALLASDPHLSLSAPAVFWPVSIDVSSGDASADLKVSGVAFPGVPGMTLGHNQFIGWGATVAGYDVTDAYQETLTPDGKAVIFQGKTVPLETVDEIIEIAGQTPYTYPVQIVPHHGPILPVIQGHKVAPLDPSVGATSIRWTGLEPTDEFATSIALLRASSVSEAKQALEQFKVGAQNWLVADTSGKILWTSHARIPIRDANSFAWDPSTYTGNLPCLVLPGDGSAEWKGDLPTQFIPGLENPASGYIATANNDPIGETFDNDPSNGLLPDGTPMYIGCSFDIGFREARIKERIEAKQQQGGLTVDDFALIQADVRSALGSKLTSAILLAIDHAESERSQPGSRPDLSAIVNDPAYDPARVLSLRALLDGWGKEADYEAASGIDPLTAKPLSEQGTDASAIEARASQATLVFNTWLLRMLRRTVGDEYVKMGYDGFSRMAQAKTLLHLFSADPTTLATYDPATGESALWDDIDTPSVESRDERVIRALLDTLATLDKDIGDLAMARWGAQHTVTFSALLPLFPALNIPPSGDPTFPAGFPRPGDLFAVDSSDFRSSFAIDASLDFRYGGGPAQRFVVDLDPKGPVAYNALPGGSVWDDASPHFRDGADLWRMNETRQVPYLLEDVIAAKESRTVMTPSESKP